MHKSIPDTMTGAMRRPTAGGEPPAGLASGASAPHVLRPTYFAAAVRAHCLLTGGFKPRGRL